MKPPGPEDAAGDVFQDRIVAALPKMRAYACRLLSSVTDADDLVQDTFARAWRSRDTFEPGTNLNAWLFRILRNEFVRQLPKRRRLVADVDGHMAARLTYAPDQEWHVQLRDVAAALPRLSNEHRQALLLVVVGGHSYEDAADWCGCGVNAMKQRVRRARTHLANLTDPPPRRAARRSSAKAAGLAVN